MQALQGSTYDQSLQSPGAASVHGKRFDQILEEVSLGIISPQDGAKAGMEWLIGESTQRSAMRWYVAAELPSGIGAAPAGCRLGDLLAASLVSANVEEARK